VRTNNYNRECRLAANPEEASKKRFLGVLDVAQNDGPDANATHVGRDLAQALLIVAVDHECARQVRSSRRLKTCLLCLFDESASQRLVCLRRKTMRCPCLPPHR